jgi:FemAB-related protein (PEP-CTERM system-associated)
MQIVDCDESRGDAWNGFVRRHPEASFYHRFEWRGINRRCFGHQSAFLAAMENGQVVGVFPIVQLKSRLFGNIACSMPFVNYGGPCADRDDIEAALLAEAERVAGRWQSDYLEIRSRRDLGPKYPGSDHKVSMTVALDPDAEKLWNAFKTGHRQDIRKGMKNGFTARFGGAELLDDFYALLSESWRDLGTPIYAKSYFADILRTFAGDVRLCVIYREQEAVATAFDGLHRDTVEGMWLAQKMALRNQNVGYVLYWELIKQACEHGYLHFHLGRSTAHSGGETFKKKWNAELRQLHWQYILRSAPTVPGLNPNNPKYRLAIEAWRRLPIGVTQRVGPAIARSIP